MIYLMQIFREESDIIGTASSLYIRLFESNCLIQTSNGVATLTSQTFPSKSVPDSHPS